MEQSTERQRPEGISDSTWALVQQVEANRPSQSTPEFARLSEKILGVQVCTSLSDEEATERVNLVPAGTTNGWVLSERPEHAPVPCDDRPETHRHLIFRVLTR